MTNINKTFLLPLIAIIGFMIFNSCKKDEPNEPIIPNEEEVITTLNFTLTPMGGGDSVVLSFQDLDGDGGDSPNITEGTLSTSTSYTGTLELLNELANPVVDITVEINEEAEEHQFFYNSSIVDLAITYNDMDANGKPIGLATTISTAEVGSGTITVILRHEPNKEGPGVAQGDITNAGGETDIQVTFNVNVQ